MIPKIRHIQFQQYTLEKGTRYVNYCGYESQGSNWNDEWMRDETLFLALPFCNNCLKSFKKSKGIDYEVLLENIKINRVEKPMAAIIKKVIKRNYYEEIKTLRNYLKN